MKFVKYSLNIIFISILFFSLNSISLAAGKVTLLIHPTLYKAMGGPEGVVADLKKRKRNRCDRHHITLRKHFG